MQVVHQRLLIGKIVSADVHDWLLKCYGLNEGAVTGFGHDDIDRGQQGFKGKWKRLNGMDAGKARWDWAINEEAIVMKLFHVFKREGCQRDTTESHQDDSFAGGQREG